MDKKPKVLVCDDVDECRVVIGAIFEAAGAAVTVVTNGKEALSAVTNTRFELIALDIRMPGLSGNSVCKELRANGFQGKIIALTATATGTGRAESKQSGIDSYFSKSAFKTDVAKALIESLK